MGSGNSTYSERAAARRATMIAHSSHVTFSNSGKCCDNMELDWDTAIITGLAEEVQFQEVSCRNCGFVHHMEV